MIGSTVRSRSVLAYDRLDAHFFTSPGVAAHERLAVAEASGSIAYIGTVADMASVWDPPRFARAWAAPLEPSKPYLRPYDVFDYLPEASERLSLLRNDDVDRLVPAPGTLMQTCSGRNLGPVTIADEDLSAYAVSHDMIRIVAADEGDRYYLLAYLKTPTGQAMLRRGRSGSVIDHITVRDVETLPVPVVADELQAAVISNVRQAVFALSAARSRLRQVLNAQEAALPTPPKTARNGGGWTQSSQSVRDRLDAGYYHPRVAEAASQVRSAGGARCGDLAEVTLPVRYKRYYVEPGHGRAILSGRQLLQTEPINLRFVSDRSFREPEKYVLRSGMTVLGADGRSEGRQGAPALVGDDRDGWLASNHVMRLTPRPGVAPAALWLALVTGQSRLQINALSFGSVVDQVNPGDVASLLLPSVASDLVAEAEQAWSDFSAASALMASGVASLESALH